MTLFCRMSQTLNHYFTYWKLHMSWQGSNASLLFTTRSKRDAVLHRLWQIYRKCIKNVSFIFASILALIWTRAGTFNWILKAASAFESLKKLTTVFPLQDSLTWFLLFFLEVHALEVERNKKKSDTITNHVVNNGKPLMENIQRDMAEIKGTLPIVFIEIGRGRNWNPFLRRSNYSVSKSVGKNEREKRSV